MVPQPCIICSASNGHLVLGEPLPDIPYVPKKQFKIIKIEPFSHPFHQNIDNFCTKNNIVTQ